MIFTWSTYFFWNTCLVRIDQLESRASDADKENEILTKEISKKKEDVKKLSDALKETYSKISSFCL